MVRVDNSVATVDFSKEVLKANVGSEGEALGIAQIVNTLTEFPSIKKVRLTVEGRDKGAISGRNIEDWRGHIGLYDQPFSRNESVKRTSPTF
jgi:germination protein M